MASFLHILINQPLSTFDQPYIYSVPEELEDQIEFGKRVLVELGHQKVEGYILGWWDQSNIKKIKPIIKVLDQEPVITKENLILAQWMSDQYLCPLALALRTMLPPMLKMKRKHVIVPLIKPDHDGPISDPRAIPLMKKLWSKGELSRREALKYAETNDLEQWQKEGLILYIGFYDKNYLYNQAYTYTLGTFDYDSQLSYLTRKAPRQAEIMGLIKVRGKMDKSWLDQRYSAVVLKALLQKGYIQLQHKEYPHKNEPPELTMEQKSAIEKICSSVDQGIFSECLLQGVTGSGKTEIYIRLAERVIQKGKGVIMLVPEIALARHLCHIFAGRIDKMAVLHSGMSSGARYHEWRRIQKGEVDLVLGTRSAVFAPLQNIGLIMIDEEHDSSYKQDELPKYHARDVARKRALLESAVLLMGSATPSLETFFRAMCGEIGLLTLTERIKGSPLPKIEIVDLRKEKGNQIIASALRERLRKNYDAGQQSILFINRRGYSPMTLCRECGNIFLCPNCSVSMTYHQDLQKNVCHYCNYQTPVLSFCQKCGSNKIVKTGIGTQKLEEEVAKLIPGAAIARLDLDISSRKGIQQDLLDRMKAGQIDILIGTQMVAKGLDFPNVTLVGIINIDNMMNLPDFRAGERAFQLIVQAAGRAGRGDQPGWVILQSYKPDHGLMELAAKQDYFSYYLQEIKRRKILAYPPFEHILRIVYSEVNEHKITDELNQLKLFIQDFLNEQEDEVTILGPAPCPIKKIKNKLRYQVLLKGKNVHILNSIGAYVMERGISRELKLEVDINPVNLM